MLAMILLTADRLVCALSPLKHKERMLAAYYEQLLALSRDGFGQDGKEIGYHNFDWHAATKNGTESFD